MNRTFPLPTSCQPPHIQGVQNSLLTTVDARSPSRLLGPASSCLNTPRLLCKASGDAFPKFITRTVNAEVRSVFREFPRHCHSPSGSKQWISFIYPFSQPPYRLSDPRSGNDQLFLLFLVVRHLKIPLKPVESSWILRNGSRCAADGGRAVVPASEPWPSWKPVKSTISPSSLRGGCRPLLRLNASCTGEPAKQSCPHRHGECRRKGGGKTDCTEAEG